MPRFSLTDAEKSLLGRALLLERDARRLVDGAALAEVALTTGAELRSLVQARLTIMRADALAALAVVDTQAQQTKNGLTAEVADIDSALVKL